MSGSAIAVRTIFRRLCRLCKTSRERCGWCAFMRRSGTSIRTKLACWGSRQADTWWPKSARTSSAACIHPWMLPTRRAAARILPCHLSGASRHRLWQVESQCAGLQQDATHVSGAGGRRRRGWCASVAGLLRCTGEGARAGGNASVRTRRTCFRLAANEVPNYRVASAGRGVAADDRHRRGLRKCLVCQKRPVPRAAGIRDQGARFINQNMRDRLSIRSALGRRIAKIFLVAIVIVYLAIISHSYYGRLGSSLM